MQRLTVVSDRHAFNNGHVIDPLVGPRVTQLREVKGWTQADLAKEAHVAPNTVGGLENGRQTRWPQFVRIAVALGVTPQALQSGFGLPEDQSLLRRLKLSDEALHAGKRFQLADTNIRLAVEHLLRAGNRDPMFRLWERVQALDARRRTLLLDGLALHEKSLADERRTKRGNGNGPSKK